MIVLWVVVSYSSLVWFLFVAEYNTTTCTCSVGISHVLQKLSRTSLNKAIYGLISGIFTT